MELEAITINDPTGEAWRQCLMGKRQMMIRELVMNAIEACQHKPEKEREIRLYGVVVPDHSGQKLAIWNRGGMALKTLVKFADINAAINKSTGHGKNFGRGAKIASIMSNMLGMRFRSCVDGRVLEVTLAADGAREIVGKVEVQNALAGTTFVRDVTHEYPDKSHDFLTTRADWTEVVLYGNEADQDTTRTPYIGAPLPESQWLWDAIGMRFFDMPAGVRLGIFSLITRHRAAASRDNPYWSWFNPLRSTLRYADRHTATPFDRGVIHYVLPDDGRAERKRERRFATNFATKPFGGVVWRGELHYLHSGTGKGQTTLDSLTWPRLALQWGLVRAYKEVCIVVELNDDEATNDINRVELVGKDGLRIEPEVFAEAVRANLPEWVRQLERDLEPKEDDALRNIRDYLRDLMRDFKNQAENLGLGGEALGADHDEDGQGDDENKGGKAARGSKLKENEEKPNSSRRKRPMEAPEAQWVNTAWFDEHSVQGMAAFYTRPTADKAGGVIFFNEEHEIFRNLVALMASRMPEDASRELVYDITKREAKQLCYLAVGTHVVGGLSMLQISTEEDVFTGLGAIVLTTAMATARFSQHFAVALANIRRGVKAGIGATLKDVAA